MPVPTPSVLVPVERAPPPPDTLHTHTTFDFFLDFFDVVVFELRVHFFPPYVLHTVRTRYSIAVRRVEDIHVIIMRPHYTLL